MTGKLLLVVMLFIASKCRIGVVATTDKMNDDYKKECYTSSPANNSISHTHITGTNTTFSWSGRSTRSVTQLGSMIMCNTGCEPMQYKRYGCYCGYRGAGMPVDYIDRCCFSHDWCYTRINCPSVIMYLIRYHWICARPKEARCGGAIPGQSLVMNVCAIQLCECDRIFTRCIAQFPCPTRKAICWSNPLIAIASLFS